MRTLQQTRQRPTGLQVNSACASSHSTWTLGLSLSVWFQMLLGISLQSLGTLQVGSCCNFSTVLYRCCCYAALHCMEVSLRTGYCHSWCYIVCTKQGSKRILISQRLPCIYLACYVLNSTGHVANSTDKFSIEDIAGRKTRYTYLAIMDWDEKEPVFVGVDKIDLEAKEGTSSTAGSVLYGPSITAGEAFFVPSHTDPAKCDGMLPAPLTFA